MNTEIKISTLADLGFTLTGRFVPFSHSRNAKVKYPSLNWKLTLHRGGREVLKDFDYTQGCAWAPLYKESQKYKWAQDALKVQCENGKVVAEGMSPPYYRLTTKDLPLPAIEDVLASLFMDASAIDCGSFKDWAADYGYSEDSISAKEAFDACIETGLKLRSALGPELFERGWELANEY